MSDSAPSNSFHVWSVIISVTSVLFVKLSIVLMLIAHTVSGKACLGRGSLMRGQTSLLRPILQVSGHECCTSVTLPLSLQLDEPLNRLVITPTNGLSVELKTKIKELARHARDLRLRDALK